MHTVHVLVCSVSWICEIEEASPLRASLLLESLDPAIVLLYKRHPKHIESTPSSALNAFIDIDYSVNKMLHGSYQRLHPLSMRRLD